jgi:succinyl-CoA synthetase beta subunit
MKIHEYQGKEVLAQHGVAVPRGIVITDAEAARAAASSSPTTRTRLSSWPAKSSA